MKADNIRKESFSDAKSDFIKDQMKKLWKNTFHDTDEYINLIFNTYFKDAYIVYYNENNNVISALFGIPYTFGNSNNKIKGMYLCGLATDPKYRGAGIMSELLEIINEKAKEENFVFTFLIPANKGLMKYYYDREYVNGFYYVDDKYVAHHNFIKDAKKYTNIIKLNIDKISENIFDIIADNINNKIQEVELNIDSNAEIINDIISYIIDKEISNTGLNILHNEKDILTIIRENIISDNNIYIGFRENKKICGIIFVNLDNESIDIRRVYSDNEDIEKELLQHVSDEYPEIPISIKRNAFDVSRTAIWENFYSGSFSQSANATTACVVPDDVYNVASHAEIYGLVRILNNSEILKFMDKDPDDTKFSILMKDEKALAEVIFRRPDADKYITEAFNLEPIKGYINLMLD